MRPGVVLAVACLAFVPWPLCAAPEPAPERRNQLFVLSVHSDREEVVYTAYRVVPGDPDTLVVQRGPRWPSGRDRVEISAAACPGLRAAVDALERTPWPSIRLTMLEAGPYLDQDRYVGYSFNGMIGHAGAISWESKLYVQDIHGQPREPFADWAHVLVQRVDACLGGPA